MEGLRSLPYIAFTNEGWIRTLSKRKDGFSENSIRHRLSPRLEQIGGHIGYKVRPACRNQGVATTALSLALQQVGWMGIERALVTCHADNRPSARVIEKCGGIRISDALTEQGVEWRYWIATAPVTRDT